MNLVLNSQAADSQIRINPADNEERLYYPTYECGLM